MLAFGDDVEALTVLRSLPVASVIAILFHDDEGDFVIGFPDNLTMRAAVLTGIASNTS